jgi:hypothetical protein
MLRIAAVTDGVEETVAAAVDDFCVAKNALACAGALREVADRRGGIPEWLWTAVVRAAFTERRWVEPAVAGLARKAIELASDGQIARIAAVAKDADVARAAVVRVRPLVVLEPPFDVERETISPEIAERFSG